MIPLTGYPDSENLEESHSPGFTAAVASHNKKLRLRAELHQRMANTEPDGAAKYVYSQWAKRERRSLHRVRRYVYAGDYAERRKAQICGELYV